MPVLPLSNEHGSQVKDQGQRQCCHNKYKKFPYSGSTTVKRSRLTGKGSRSTAVAIISTKISLFRFYYCQTSTVHRQRIKVNGSVAIISIKNFPMPVLLLSNEHGSHVKDQVRRQCCHNKHKKFPYAGSNTVKRARFTGKGSRSTAVLP